MGSSTALKGSEPEHSSYALAKSRKRCAVRKRIHEQVLHPIDTPSLLRDPLYHPTSPIDSTIDTLKLVITAVAVHGFIILLFAAVNDLMGEQAQFKAPERVVVTVIESEPPPPPPPVIEKEETIEGPVQPDFVPKDPIAPPKAPEPKKRKIIKKVDPTPPPVDPVAPPPPKRVHIGTNYETTTTGGKGPAISTGTSRMGETARTAADPNVARQDPVGEAATAPTGKGKGGGKGAATREQRVASNIPTRDAVFVKPKRSKPSKPPYPATLEARGQEGDVQVRVSLDAKGKVTKVTVLKGSGHSAFDYAAKKAALAEQFKPATRDGKAVAYTLSYSYRFRIEEN
ncbi:MAG: energy transducer TonB [Myxococcales bacterium]|nr:energy transducer TonB [Myxococcales bacterium]